MVLLAFCHKGGVICISEVIDISPSNLDSSLCFFQHSVSHGFALKGGLEHGEPLIISNIKEGGKAYLVSSRLQAGEEVVNINEVAVSSS